MLLEGYGTALTYEPTAADDKSRIRTSTARRRRSRSTTRSSTAARPVATRRSFKRPSSGTEPHDLSKLIKAQRDTFEKLDGHESAAPGPDHQLQRHHGRARRRAGQRLGDHRRAGAHPRAGRADAAPHQRRAAAAARPRPLVLEPSVRELPGTIRAAGPWIDQTNLLLRDEELGGLARLLGDSAAPLAKTVDGPRSSSSRSSRSSVAAPPRCSSPPATSSSTTASPQGSRTSTSSSTASQARR